MALLSASITGRSDRSIVILDRRDAIDDEALTTERQTST